MRNLADGQAAPARFTEDEVEAERCRPVRGEPEVADPSDHGAEHHEVEHEGADDGDQLDAVHPLRRRGRLRADIPYRTSPEHDQQEGVEGAEGLAIRRAAEAGHGVDDGGAGQHHCEQRREEHREHRCHVLHDPLLRLDEPRGHDHSTRRSPRAAPTGDPLDVDPSGFEDPRSQTHEHAAPERDQHVDETIRP